MAVGHALMNLTWRSGQMTWANVLLKNVMEFLVMMNIKGSQNHTHLKDYFSNLSSVQNWVLSDSPHNHQTKFCM